jgi:OFA family oxalate/formate antiporter-like MFS transporter
MYTAKGAASLLVPVGNLLTQTTGNWHIVYALGCGMNVVAALLGFFVLKPIIAERLKKPAAALAHDTRAVPAE